MANVDWTTGLPQFHPSNSFGYLLDVLDGGETGDESDQPPEVFGGKQLRSCPLFGIVSNYPCPSYILPQGQ